MPGSVNGALCDTGLPMVRVRGVGRGVLRGAQLLWCAADCSGVSEGAEGEPRESTVAQGPPAQQLPHAARQPALAACGRALVDRRSGR